jgi:hypothetical protein
MEKPALDLAAIHEIIKADLPPGAQRSMFALATRIFNAGFAQDDIEIVMRDYLRRRGAIRAPHAYYSPKGTNLSYILALAHGAAPRTKSLGRVRQNEATPVIHGLAKALEMKEPK